MKTKYLILPLSKNALVKQEIYKKGKSTFYTESTWPECSILTDEIPKSKKNGTNLITNLKEITFKNHAYNCKEKLIISDGVPEEDVKIIKREYRKDNIYFIDEFGWRASKTTYTLHGQFDY